MKPTLTILALVVTALALATNQPAPKADASPAFESSLSIANAELKKRVENLQSENARLVADAAAIHAAPLVVTTPGVSTAELVRNSQEPEAKAKAPLAPDVAGKASFDSGPAAYLPAAFVAASRPPVRSQQCSGGQCNPPADTRRYVPLQRARGILFGRRR